MPPRRTASEAREQVPILDLGPEIAMLWPEVADALERVARSGTFVLGPEVEAFEREVATYLGVAHAVGLNSGTDALVIALRALGIGPGDEVITTPFSFFATAEAISLVGATPVFADVEEDSFGLDPQHVAERIGSRTRALLPVHLYGLPCRIEALAELARAHDLLLIEDCAQSFGARRAGRATGTFGHAGAYSFFPSKNLGAFGDGGLLVSDDEAVADAARALRTHGSRVKYRNEQVGYNSRLDEIQAAVLRAKLPHVDAWNARRRAAARRYGHLLAGLPGVRLPAIDDEHVVHQYTVRIEGGRRDRVRDALAAAGIGTMIYYPVPIDRLPVYAGAVVHATSVAGRMAEEVLSLPIGPFLEAETQERVADALRQAVQ